MDEPKDKREIKRDDKRAKKADDFFKRELSDAEIENPARLSYRDGFRLGFGFFIGFVAATLILVLIVYGINMLFKLF